MPSRKRCASTQTGSSPAEATSAFFPVERLPLLPASTLSMADLFSLREEVIDLVYPYYTQLLPDPSPDDFQSIRNLCRRILDGCKVLEPFTMEVELESFDRERWRTDRDVRKRREKLGKDRLEELGLVDGWEEGQLQLLRAFALLHLAEVASGQDETEQREDDSGTSKESSSEKDTGEVGDSEYDDSYAEENGEDVEPSEISPMNSDNDLYVSTVCNEGTYCAIRYATALLDDGKRWKADGLREVPKSLGATNGTSNWGLHQTFAYSASFIDGSDAALSGLRAMSAWVALVEADPSLVGGRKEVFEALDKALKSFAQQKMDVLGDETDDQDWTVDEEHGAEQIQLWRFLFDGIGAQAKAAAFNLKVDQVEEFDGGDEGLAKMLKRAMKAGAAALDAARASVKAYDELAEEHKQDEALKEEYRQLAHLLTRFLTLFRDPDGLDEEEKAKKEAIEAELGGVKKEGKLDEDA
ncbi:hypothetical protein JCM10213_005205 [Rhodosporidiobolus nylandii]